MSDTSKKLELKIETLKQLTKEQADTVPGAGMTCNGCKIMDCER